MGAVMRKQLITPAVVAVFGAALIGGAPEATGSDYKSVYSCVKENAGAKAAARYKAGKPPRLIDKEIVQKCKEAVAYSKSQQGGGGDNPQSG